MPSTNPTQRQWPRGRFNELHQAAVQGSMQGTIALLSTGSINIDQGDPTGITPLMFAAEMGHSRVARVLLNRGADLSIAEDEGFSALHISAQEGHLAVTVDLVTAGADLEARANDGTTPLHLAADGGRSQVMAALVEAGSKVDSRCWDGTTPLYLAAGEGHVGIVKELLRAKANPQLGRMTSNRESAVPLDAAVEGNHSHMVRELIKQCGIKGCTGASGGLTALRTAAQRGFVSIMSLLTDAGVVDTGLGLVFAAGWGGETPVKWLLQQRQLAGPPTAFAGYANSCDHFGCTALFRSIDFCIDAEGTTKLISPRVVRLLIDAGADTTSAFRQTNEVGIAQNLDTPLAFISERLLKKKIRELNATEEQLRGLEAVRRLLLQVEAVHAVSWLWRSDLPSIAQAARDRSKTTPTTPANSAQLTLMLPILRRRRRGALLSPLLRYSSYP